MAATFSCDQAQRSLPQTLRYYSHLRIAAIACSRLINTQAFCRCDTVKSKTPHGRRIKKLYGKDLHYAFRLYERGDQVSRKASLERSRSCWHGRPTKRRRKTRRCESSATVQKALQPLFGDAVGSVGNGFYRSPKWRFYLVINHAVRGL